ncbi:replication-associated recombination protein A [bacterium]|nr:replication-associated recombination protein A [bacterium]
MPLFGDAAKQRRPLAYRLAPLTLNDYIGHQDIIGEGTPLRKMIEADRIPSLIMWGPPGSGKTSLARLISRVTQSQFIPLNAVNSKIQDLKQAVDQARSAPHLRTIVFIDEIHRFTKTQQDALLPDVERGLITLIGATTENPFFSVIPGLISRCMIVEMKPYTEGEQRQLFSRAVAAAEIDSRWEPPAIERAIRLSAGDARKLINLVEYVALTNPESVTVTLIDQLSLSSGVAHNTDAHYDLISAFIKSMRGSDSDAALYWLARLLRGGEDPRFIARRLVIFASEDIGNADPAALGMATAAFAATETIGMPEVRIILGQVTAYFAAAPKSKAAYDAINAAIALVDNGNIKPVPPFLQ